ncbi:MAG: tryptophan--tRNA ligase [Candidatus Improbicoccus devescovinae]|nr:MAG: tryptophan--tRNA ligase [Candidatus Improbicoccus devescovinae]
MSINKKKIIFSAVQPSGDITIGNYLGAIKRWVDYQNKYNCIFSLADLHSITVRQDSVSFHENIIKSYVLLLACGIDIEKSLFFIQSHVPEHSQLGWVLNCYTQYGELARMTQFKDKSQRYQDNINSGLFTYPCLMAADILLYDTNFVPVGKDQKQHVELARDVAQRFNSIYGDVFVVPESMIPEVGAKIMSLTDPSKKMSKSMDSAAVINILDEPDMIFKKIKRSVTDSDSEVKFKDSKNGVTNLLNIFACFQNMQRDQVEEYFLGKNYGFLKKTVAEVVIEHVRFIQKKYYNIIKNMDFVESRLSLAAENAHVIACKKLKLVMEKIGFLC